MFDFLNFDQDVILSNVSATNFLCDGHILKFSIKGEDMTKLNQRLILIGSYIHREIEIYVNKIRNI